MLCMRKEEKVSGRILTDLENLPDPSIRPDHENEDLFNGPAVPNYLSYSAEQPFAFASNLVNLNSVFDDFLI